ncbi:putative ribonuclease H protein, partial [Trifolium medium]|nr:putative ribonuclease H protein [Trifolium medium]
MGIWDNFIWSWKLVWTEALNVSEAETARELHALLEQVQPKCSSRDKRRWIPNSAGFFSVRSAYEVQQSRLEVAAICTQTEAALKMLWFNNVPSKVSIFGWRLLLEKLPTREALHRRGIITNNHEKCCVFCFKEEDDLYHIFFKCSIVMQVWQSIFVWLNTNFIHFVTVPHHFSRFGDIAK